MMNFFRKRYTPANQEEFIKTQNDVKNLEILMRNIEKAIQAYGPHYQAIQQANNTIAKELAKFYERYPEFKEVAQKVDNAFKFHNHRIDEFIKKLAAFKVQFEGWFVNFEVLKEVWKKFDEAQQNYLHYQDKLEKLVPKLGGKINPKDEEQILRNDSKCRDAKLAYEKIKEDMDNQTEKILYFSYQLVNPVISELFEAKAKCFEGFGENYQVFQGISGQIDDMEVKNNALNSKQ